TLLFVAILLWSIVCIHTHSLGLTNALFFLAVNILGIYNHILFLCFPMSLLIATIFYGMQDKSFYPNRLVILIFALLNSTVVFGLMYFSPQDFIDEHIVTI